jgi:hypothetical protein
LGVLVDSPEEFGGHAVEALHDESGGDVPVGDDDLAGLECGPDFGVGVMVAICRR